MAHQRSDVVECAHRLLDAHGLAALTMRRLGAELDVQPSAIYHHFANKQALLAAVAEEILRRGRRPRAASADWADQVVQICTELRTAMLSCTDGADVVATVWAYDLGLRGPADEIALVLTEAGLDETVAAVGSGTLLHYVFGHAFEEQTAVQAITAGAVQRPLSSLPDFGLGLGIIVDGLRTRLRSAHHDHDQRAP